MEKNEIEKVAIFTPTFITGAGTVINLAGNFYHVDLTALKLNAQEAVIEGSLVRRRHDFIMDLAETLSEYDAIIPNGAERIMQKAEKQLEHRLKMENKVVSGQMQQSNIGPILAFLIGTAALLCATYCIVSGHEWSGIILGIGGLTGLVTAFIKGQSQ